MTDTTTDEPLYLKTEAALVELVDAIFDPYGEDDLDWKLKQHAEYVRKLAAERDALRKQVEWSDDMDAAPTDGTEILGWRDDWGVFVVLFGAMDIFGMSDNEAEKIPEDQFWQEDWWTYGRDGIFRLDKGITPTHWMPMPKPPEEVNNG